MTAQPTLLMEPPRAADPFDPLNWDEWSKEEKTEQAERLTHIRRDYAEVDAEVNAAINALDEAADLHPGWAGISLGGPVEPFMPTMPWNGIIIVGKAPGDAELAHGVPFTGRVGRLLDQMLVHCHIDREACILTNVFRMQAPWGIDADGRRKPNDESHFFTDDPREGNDKLPPYRGRWVLKGPDEHVRDLWRLIRAHRPKVVIGLGAIAAWGLTHDATLEGRMGEPLQNGCSSSPVVLTNHPAYALHQRSEATAAKIAEHIAVAKRLADVAP